MVGASPIHENRVYGLSFELSEERKRELRVEKVKRLRGLLSMSKKELIKEIDRLEGEAKFSAGIDKIKDYFT